MCIRKDLVVLNNLLLKNLFYTFLFILSHLHILSVYDSMNLFYCIFDCVALLFDKTFFFKLIIFALVFEYIC